MLTGMLGLALAATAAAVPPSGRIENGQLSLTYYRPDPTRGFYRGTRFDWSGIISSLRYRGTEFYGPWYDRIDPAVRDVTDEGGAIAVGRNSSAMGPAEEFSTDGKALGFDRAAPGGTFVKIGVGVLRRPDDAPYSPYGAYAIVDAGRWETQAARDRVTFRQTLTDPMTGIGYIYTKTLSLPAGQPELRIDHSLRNTGREPIRTSVYNHNFLVAAPAARNAGRVIALPFAVTTSQPPDPALARIERDRIIFPRALGPGERVYFPIEGFDPAVPYAFRVASADGTTAVEIKGDRPASRIALWSIRSNLSVEPFTDLSVAPGAEVRWGHTYTYTAPPAR